MKKSINKYGEITTQPDVHRGHERQYKVTFWSLLANFSGLALGINSALTFFMRNINIFENQRAMITELYNQQTGSKFATNQTPSQAPSSKDAIKILSESIQSRQSFLASYFGKFFFNFLLDYCLCCFKRCLQKCYCYERRKVNYEKFDLALGRLSQE